jgi:integrase
MASVFKRGGKGNRGGYWYISWFDHTGKRCTKSARTTDKATAERIGAKLDTEAAKRREGLIDPQIEGYVREAKRPLAELVTEYKAKLVANALTERYIGEAVGYIERFAEAEGIETVAGFTAERMAHYAAGLSDAAKSARTVQASIGAVKSFTRWLVACEKLPRDPLAGTRKPNPDANRKRRRRMLLPEEWPLLESATIHAPERFGMAGSERALLYRTAIQTGLRANELRSLRRESIVLGSTQPCVLLDAVFAKNRRSARVQIDRSLADLLREFLAPKLPNCEVFQLPHASNLARMLRRDLADARKRWIAEAKKDPQEITRRQQSDFLATKDHSGHLLDFHSLRHTCGGWLANSGAHPKTVQAVMRHSTITLTMDRYGHLLPGAETDAATQLGEMVSLCGEPNGAEENVLQMTGTDTASAQRQEQQSGRDSTRREDAACDEEKQARNATKKPKALTAVTLGDEEQADAAACESAPSWTRTMNLLIKSQLLCQLS